MTRCHRVVSKMPFAWRNERKYEEDNRNRGRGRGRNDSGNPGGQERSRGDAPGRE